MGVIEMKDFVYRTTLAIFIVLLASFILSGCQPNATVDPASGSAFKQTTCPVMVNTPINRQVNTIYKGKKVYFCCKGCISRFKANPEKYLDKLPQFNE